MGWSFMHDIRVPWENPGPWILCSCGWLAGVAPWDVHEAVEVARDHVARAMGWDVNKREGFPSVAVGRHIPRDGELSGAYYKVLA